MGNLLLAYVDPASGSILLQLLLGAAVGVFVFFRRNLGRLVGLFRRGSHID